jgi:hypothetical protein
MHLSRSPSICPKLAVSPVHPQMDRATVSLQPLLAARSLAGKHLSFHLIQRQPWRVAFHVAHVYQPAQHGLSTPGAGDWAAQCKWGSRPII